MTKLDRANDDEFEARIKRRKRIGADLGLIAAGTTVGGLATKGGGMAAKKFIPAASHAAKADKIVNRVAGTSVTTSGVTGATAAVNNNLVTQAELKRRDGKRKDVYRVKRQLQPVSKSASKNLEQNRQKRSKTYPKLAAAGAAATGVGAVGTLGSKKAISSLDTAKGKFNTKFSDGQKKQDTGNVRFREAEAKSANTKPGASRNSNANKMARGRAEIAQGLKRQKRAKLGIRFASGSQKVLKPFTKPKVGLALGAASAGLAATSAVAHRNNKKGVTRPRHDWWQG